MPLNDTREKSLNEIETARQSLLEGDGYHVLKGAVDAGTAAAIRAEVLARLDEGEENAPGDINLTGLLHRGEMFRALAVNPRILPVARALLGDDAKLAAFSAKVLMPGCGKGRLHVDYPYWAMDPGMPVAPALMMQVIWMMEPFSTENGGTWIAPGSQRYGQQVDIERFRSEARQVTGAAGDAFISHGMLWHQTAVNASARPRVAILINYAQLSIRPMRELGPFDQAFLDDLSPDLRRLLPVDYGRDLMARLKKHY